MHGPFRYSNDGCISHQIVNLFSALKCQYLEQVDYIPGKREVSGLRHTRI